MKRYDLDLTPSLFSWAEPALSKAGAHRHYSREGVVDTIIALHEARVEELRSIANHKTFREAFDPKTARAWS